MPLADSACTSTRPCTVSPAVAVAVAEAVAVAVKMVRKLDPTGGCDQRVPSCEAEKTKSTTWGLKGRVQAKAEDGGA